MTSQAPAQRVLLDRPHVQLTYEPVARLVRYVRTSEPYRSLDELRANHADIARVVAEVPAAALLIDVRGSPARNDAEFEAAVTQALGTWLPRFPVYAVLVKTASGLLQTQRLARERGEQPNVFTDEAAALRHLRAGRAGT